MHAKEPTVYTAKNETESIQATIRERLRDKYGRRGRLRGEMSVWEYMSPTQRKHALGHEAMLAVLTQIPQSAAKRTWLEAQQYLQTALAAVPDSELED